MLTNDRHALSCLYCRKIQQNQLPDYSDYHSRDLKTLTLRYVSLTDRFLQPIRTNVHYAKIRCTRNSEKKQLYVVKSNYNQRFKVKAHDGGMTISIQPKRYLNSNTGTGSTFPPSLLHKDHEDFFVERNKTLINDKKCKIYSYVLQSDLSTFSDDSSTSSTSETENRGTTPKKFMRRKLQRWAHRTNTTLTSIEQLLSAWRHIWPYELKQTAGKNRRNR